MKCVLCLYLRVDINDAITVARGWAVCDEHMSYAVGGEEWVGMFAIATKEEN